MPKTHANRLPVIRAERGLNQAEAAELLGLKVARYQRLETGKSHPTDDELQVIVQHFGKDHGIGRPRDRPDSGARNLAPTVSAAPGR